MRESGYSGKARLAFDHAVVSFVNRFESLRQETVERPAPESGSRKPTIQVPKYTREELLGFLGIAIGAGNDGEAAGGRWVDAGPVQDEDWASVWDDEG
jgi:hypothetical protein